MRELIAERMRVVRKHLKLTQKQMSIDSGIPLPTLKDWEGGKGAPSSEGLAALVRLGINANWILEHKPPMLLSEKSAHARGVFDPALMKEVIETVEEIFYQTDRKMAPAGKAEFILSIYDIYCDAEVRPDKQKVLKLVKSAKLHT